MQYCLDYFMVFCLFRNQRLKKATFYPLTLRAEKYKLVLKYNVGGSNIVKQEENGWKA